jgi:hypothetical protein
MKRLNQAQQKFAAFMAQKLSQELRGELPANAPKVLEIIRKDILISAFGYNDSPQWNRYIIDLESDIAPDVFFYNNPIYRHTPRIFKVGIENPIYGIEKLKRTCEATPELREATAQAVEFARMQGVAVIYKNADDIYFVREIEETKIKFKYFRLVSVEGDTDE